MIICNTEVYCASDKEIEFVIENEQITKIKELQRSCGFRFEIRNA